MRKQLIMTGKGLVPFFLVLLLLLSCNEGLCADLPGTSDTGKEQAEPQQTARDWNAQLSTGYLAASNLRGATADASISDVRLRLTRNFQLSAATTLTVGGGYGVKHIDASSGANLPQDLHTLSLETGLSYRINQRSFVSLKVFPGFYSDFKDLGSDDVRMPLLALGSYTFNNGINLVGGFLYRVGYQASPFLPIIGMSYQPVPEWRIDLVMPRPGVTYIPSRQIRLFLAGDFAGDEYQLHEASLKAKVLKYRDLKVMGGVDYLPRPGITCSAAVGYAFDRSFEFYDTTRTSLRIDNVPFVKLSLDIGW